MDIKFGAITRGEEVTIRDWSSIGIPVGICFVAVGIQIPEISAVAIVEYKKTKNDLTRPL